MKKLIFSTVIYNTPKNFILRLIDSIESLSSEIKKKKCNISIEKLLICDNSKFPKFSINNLNTNKVSFEIVFSKTKNNLGYGLGHNFNLLKEKSNDDIWFIAINPDIYFSGINLFSFFEYILFSENISCAAPLIHLPNGTIQYSAKKDPTMASLLISRFSIFRLIPNFNRYLKFNQNKSFNYKKDIIISSFLSGCFLVFPSNIYKKIGGFSPKYFLHFEDADIVRRASFHGLTIHCPYGWVTHIRGRGSHKSFSQQIYLA